METQQNEQKKSIFRQRAMDRISSPEELDQYLKVTGLGVWIPLVTVIVLLIGSIFWMVLGHADISINVAVNVKDGAAVCYVPAERREAAVSRGTVTIAGKAYPMTDSGLAELYVDETLDLNVRRTGTLELGSIVAPLKVSGDLVDGIYSGTIVVESINPIKFIIN